VCSLPFLVLLYIGGYQLSDAISAYRKVAVATRTVADLTSQFTSVSDDDVNTILDASAQVLAPYKISASKITVSQIKMDGSGNATVDWNLGDFGASVTGRYIHHVTEVGGLDPSGLNKLNSRTYVDFQLEYSPSMFLDKRLTFTAGINNLFDKDPPGCFSCSGGNYDPGTYDAPGRWGYARITYKM